MLAENMVAQGVRSSYGRMSALEMEMEYMMKVSRLQMTIKMESGTMENGMKNGMVWIYSHRRFPIVTER